MPTGSRGIIRKLKAAGWRRVAQSRSHVQLKHPKKKGRVTVPHPNRDLPVGTVKSIEKQSGVRLGRARVADTLEGDR